MPYIHVAGNFNSWVIERCFCIFTVHLADLNLMVDNRNTNACYYSILRGQNIGCVPRNGGKGTHLITSGDHSTIILINDVFPALQR